jgi:hypothetical protein
VLVGLELERAASGGGVELGAAPDAAAPLEASAASFVGDEQAMAALSSALTASASRHPARRRQSSGDFALQEQERYRQT